MLTSESVRNMEMEIARLRDENARLLSIAQRNSDFIRRQLVLLQSQLLETHRRISELMERDDLSRNPKEFINKYNDDDLIFKLLDNKKECNYFENKIQY